MKLERDLNNEINLFPVYYNGKYWNKKECGTVFRALYHDRNMLRGDDGCVYVCDGSWVFPDDIFEHDKNR
jgi:hypothetical protein